MSAVLHLNPPTRAEHIGSLLRPAKLIAKRTDYEANKCSAEELRVVEDESIPAVVKLQQEVGVKTITDGEYRRGAFYQGIFEKLEGMTIMPTRQCGSSSYIPYVAIFKAMGLTEYTSIYCTGKIKRAKGVHTEDFKFLKELVAPEDVKFLKVTICGPTWMHLRHGPEYTYNHSVYKTDAEYFADLIKAYREEIDELYQLGCRHIQFDDPTFSFFCAESMIDGMREAGVNHEALLSMYIDVYNDILKDRPADLTVGVHTCRGNYKGMHYTEGSLDRIAEKFFRDLQVDVYYLEYDTERSGGLEPLRYLPTNKVVVLGLVTSKSEKLEDIASLKKRVEEAAEIISQGHPKRSKVEALNQLCLSPQCGFASVFEGNPISEEGERSKLELVVAAAKQIWQ
ncbi:UROD/MetE-like protein [Laetiporus sulphureus 93-53]|uniref:UROD/MetE-like protein n=1 Tax=Laetiporus sulphureus 93-53 TaxID=1314785 RepID=A0A165E0M1_9APHY|nr:UROD/MetE-like protein [Laetiporus sulphureus 93-53]KZT06018.1 UROD/MetE-like protein [Laetiporus sulphureus 93-53]